MARRPIRIEELPAELATLSEGTSALDAETSGRLALRFRLDADAENLEALRLARRSLLREEWTLGLEPGEPSLEGAMFSTTEIVWSIRPEQRSRCEEKLRELIARANRAAESSAAESTATRRARFLREE